MHEVTAFKSAFVNSIRGSISDNVPKYTADSPWVLDSLASQRDLPTSLRFSEELELLPPDGSDLKDLENSIRIHKALPMLTPVQARDPRLWTRLTHVELWPYMRKRWPVERSGADKEKAKRFVESRYFVTQSQSRALLRNGAARLWWSAKMSYSEDRDNPYELTRVLFSTLDITQQILERSLGRAPVVVHSFLSFLLQNQSLLLGGGDQSRDLIRRLAKFLNMQGGACLLDTLPQGAIVALLEEELARIAPEPAESEAG